MRRILAILVLVALGGLTACDPEEALSTIQQVYDAHRAPADDPSMPGVEGDPSQPPFCLTCPVMPVMPEPPLPPVPVQAGWTWDVSTFTVTNHDVSSGIRVSASYGPDQTPLLPFTVLMPGQSVTIPAAPCGQRVRVFVNNGARPEFTFC